MRADAMGAGVFLQKNTFSEDIENLFTRYPVSSFTREIALIAIIVPAHNEEDQITTCLAAVQVAAHCPRLGGERTVVVVLDACTDTTRSIAHRMGVTTIALNARNVGEARALGAELALAAGARWLAFTEADSHVAPDWISAQLGQRCDAVCGTVAVRDWGTYSDAMRHHYDATDTDVDGHRHIHGANFGISALAYQRAGGFRPLGSSEDVALLKALQASGASIAWSAAPRVFTSARRSFWVPGEFGATLARDDTGSRAKPVAGLTV